MNMKKTRIIIWTVIILFGLGLFFPFFGMLFQDSLPFLKKDVFLRMPTLFLLTSTTIMIIFGFWVIFLSSPMMERKFKSNKAMRFFAEKNNFNFKQEMGMKDSGYQLLNSGNNRKFFNHIEGNYKGNRVEIYNYQHQFDYHIINGSPLSDVCGYTVFETETKKVLPTAIITTNNSYLGNFFHSSMNIVQSYKLKTESNAFNEDFKIFLKKEGNNNENKEELMWKIYYKRNNAKYNSEDAQKVLEILTPDVISHLIDEEEKEQGKDINLEFDQNTILLYRDGILTKEESIQRMLDLLIYLKESFEG